MRTVYTARPRPLPTFTTIRNPYAIRSKTENPTASAVMTETAGFLYNHQEKGETCMGCATYELYLERLNQRTPMSAERLLRRLGICGSLKGFRYAVYMLERVVAEPDQLLLITKGLYPETARHFQVTPEAVERALRTMIRVCWERMDHDYLEYVAGRRLEHAPTNSEFLDMLAAFLRDQQCDGL